MSRDSILIFFGAELLTALDEYAAKKGRERSAVVREAVAHAIGKPKLAKTVRRGRPKNPEAD